MKVKLLRTMNIPMPKGSEVEVDEARAKWLMSVGAAAPVELPKKKAKTKKED